MNLHDFTYHIFTPLHEGLAVLFLFIYLINKRDFIKLNKFRTTIYIITVIFTSYWVDTFIPKGFNTPIYLIYHILLLSFITRTSLIASSIATILISIFMIITEVIIGIPAVYIVKIDVANFTSNPKVLFISSFILAILRLLIIFLMYHYQFTLTKFDIFKKENNFLTYLILQVCVNIIFVTCAININYFVLQNRLIFIQVLFFIVIILNILIGFIEFKDREKDLKLRYRLLAQEENAKYQEELNKVLKKERHDVGTYFYTILALSRIKKVESLDKIEEVVGGLTTENNASYQTYSTNNETINCLLAVKHNTAYENNIKLEADFSTMLDKVEVDDKTLISIFGNIIDNAIQAITSNPGTGEKYVKIEGFSEGNNYHLIFSNNGPAITSESIKKVFEKGYSTMKENKSDHGFGLHIIKNLVEKNRGKIEVISTENETKFTVIFPIRNENKV